MGRQLALELVKERRKWGKGMSHLRRAEVPARCPVHVTVRMLPHVWNLRSSRSFAVVGRAIYAASARYSMRVCEFSVQGNHVHLVVEAADREALAQGMKGLGVRIARGMNRAMLRRGRVIADRYHAHVLRTPTEVRHAVNYVLQNYRRHAGQRGVKVAASLVDPYSSASGEHGIALPRAQTWPLREIASSSLGGNWRGARG